VKTLRFSPEDRQAPVALSQEQMLLSPAAKGEYVLGEFRQLMAADAAGPPGRRPAEDRLDSLDKQPASLLGWRLAGVAFAAPTHVLGGQKPELAACPHKAIGRGVTLDLQRLEPVEKHGDLSENNGPNLRKWRSDIADNESNPWHGPLAGYMMGKSAQVLLGMPLKNHR
jgi:hypothetical protein